MSAEYDVLVVGAGHAGCEAALAASRLGAAVGLVTMPERGVASMPCNPAIGGPGKGHLVREIDAMGGAMGAIADGAALQARLLNTGKGPAVQALRLLTDKQAYSQNMYQRLLCEPRVDLVSGEAAGLLIDSDGGVGGVTLSDGRTLRARAVVLATGVYLNSSIVVGSSRLPAGPDGARSTRLLPKALLGAGLRLGRFKTGTSPRVDRHSVDYRRVRPELGTASTMRFGHCYAGDTAPLASAAGQEPVCWVTHTNETTHAIIAGNLHRSPLFDGTIAGVGPRHCPSIEDKVHRFPHRDRHPVWLERESMSSDLLYVLGMSTSLPEDVQSAMVRSLPGLAGAEIVRPGYAIEYEYLLPGQLFPTMELKRVRGLFAAGQICGTSGYEEAAALGLIAGTNAARRALGEEPVVWHRSESYLGVLADDLTTRQVSEPYRMMTARAEHRLHLRHSNADLRLAPVAAELGLMDAAALRTVARRRKLLADTRTTLMLSRVMRSEALDRELVELGTTPLRQGVRAWSLLKRPSVRYEHMCAWVGQDLPQLSYDDRQELEAMAKYGGYIRQQESLLSRQRRMAARPVPAQLDYTEVPGLAHRAAAHLGEVRPLTLGQASRVEGVTSADLSVLAGYLRKWRRP